jgi:hypothetical protein
MTDAYSWEWISSDSAVITVHRPLKLADAEALEAALPQHRAAGPADSWGLVVDLRNAGVADEAVQEVLKRVMRAGDEAGCAAVAMVISKTIVQMQSQRLSAEAQQTSVAMFDSLEAGIASVATRLAAAA